MEITLDTLLSDIGYDNATKIGDDLIDTSIVGDDWGRAWAQAQHGTVADLKEILEAQI